MVAAAINCALGIEPNLTPSSAKYGVCIRYFCPRPGKLVSIENMAILNDPHVYEWKFYHKIGDEIPPVTSSLSRSGHLIVTEGSPQKAIELADKLVKDIVFDIK